MTKTLAPVKIEHLLLDASHNLAVELSSIVVDLQQHYHLVSVLRAEIGVQGLYTLIFLRRDYA